MIIEQIMKMSECLLLSAVKEIKVLHRIFSVSQFLYPPAHCKWWGGILNSPCPSVRPSRCLYVSPSVALCVSVHPCELVYNYTGVPTYRLFLCFGASTLL